MQRPGLIPKYLIVAAILLAVLLLLAGPAPRPGSPADGHPTVFLFYTSAGSISQLLNTGQIDSFMGWEPFVANVELAGIGKKVAVPSELPPPGKWANAACCVFVLRNDVIAGYPGVSAILSALTTAAIDRTNADPAYAKNVTAEWVFGEGPILTPEGSLDPLAVENLSFSDMVFTARAGLPESGLVGRVLKSTGGGSYDPARMTDPAVFERGLQYLNGSAPELAGGEIPTLNIGYLPSTDNFAPLYVMVRDSAYFCDRYGFCLVPDDPGESRPVHCTLLAGGAPVAHVDLIPAQSGGGIMTTIGQEALDGAYVGSVPAELQIALGNPASIIQSIDTGGSGLVVDPDAPCSDWESFIGWVKSRSAAGDPVIVATIQSSIQEDIIRSALAYENITVILYGTNIETTYP
jgi:ABC-type nitrate/sulfonate/bicarbonate transport system substrate-binding protein